MRLLVPTDFSACAEAALDWAVDLARRYHAELCVLHVYPVPAYTFLDGIVPPTPADMAEVAQAATRRLDELATRFQAEVAPGSVHTEVRAGDPVHGIVEAVRDLQVDLVVMGTHGRTGLAHLVLGSVAERVVRECPCPVLTVRAGEHGEHIAPPSGFPA